MIALNTSKGLGDAIYLRVIAAHFRRRGEDVCVFTSWPDVFIGLDVALRPLAELPARGRDREVFYCLFCRIQSVRVMDQFSMACAQAGLDETIPLRMEWDVQNTALIERIRNTAGGRKILVYQPPKLANNEEQVLIRPNVDAFMRRLDTFSNWFRVRIGDPAYVQDIQMPCDLDLFGRTSVADALDICAVGDMAYSDESYLRVAFEAMDKPFVTMYSRRALASSNLRVSNVKPSRVINKLHLATAVYDS